MDSRVCLIILNWNGYRDTCDCLESLQQLSFEYLQTVVVDNASSDNSLDEIEAWAKRSRIETIHLDRKVAETCNAVAVAGAPSSDPRRSIILIQTGANLGFAGGNNVGMRYALQTRAEYVWLLNNDTIVEPQCLEPLLDLMHMDDKVGFVGSRVLYYDRPNVIQGAGMKLGLHNCRISHLDQGRTLTESLPCEPRNVDCVAASSMLVRSKLIEDVGLMDEDYFMYHEDVDWQIRARRAGWKVYCAPKSRILHKCGRSTGRSCFIPAYYQSRNKFLLISKNEGKLASLLLIPLAFAFLLNICRALAAGDRICAWGIWEGGKDFFLGRRGPRHFEKVREPVSERV